MESFGTTEEEQRYVKVIYILIVQFSVKNLTYSKEFKFLFSIFSINDYLLLCLPRIKCGWFT